MEGELSFKIEGAPDRLDKALLEYLKTQRDFELISRTQVQEWIDEGSVTVNGKTVFRSSQRVGIGSLVVVAPPEIEPREILPYDFPLSILFEDPEIIVINKPAGLTVHPGAGNKDKTLVNALVHRYGESFSKFSASDRPGVVHRLDKDTTGVLVVARTERAMKGLIEQFSSRKANRQYLALVRTLPRAEGGVHSNESGRIETNLGRHPSRRTEMAVLSEGGLYAVTNWKVEERFNYGALVRLSLETGRTHQIRVHMNHINSPVIGDATYGDFDMLPFSLLRASNTFARQALHAETLGFKHPVSGEELKFSAPMPQDMTSLVEIFRKFV